jgi:hypothetical protein
VVDAVEKSMKLVEDAQRVVNDLNARIEACKASTATDGGGSARTDSADPDKKDPSEE